MKRRDLIKLAGGVAVAGTGISTLTACGNSAPNIKRKKEGVQRVVVIGAGSGGIATAQAIKKTAPEIEVIIVERNTDYTTCYASNWVLNDTVTIEDITFDYKTLQTKHNISVLQGEATGIDADNKIVHIKDADSLEYDRLVVSPGISFRWDDIEGLDESTTEVIPHAWKAGKQTEILKQQIDAMPDDGTFVMRAPTTPFRCPPGPYERVSLVANYFKKNKPNAKIIVLDAKNKFSKMKKFKKGWATNYGYGTDDSMIEWISLDEGGEVKSIDPKTKVITTTEGEKIKADVINYIPTQKASVTAEKMGLVDQTGWCPIHASTFESKLVANVHVLGDASMSSTPKSAFSAGTQATVCGAAIVDLLKGKEPNASPMLFNQCFSLITHDYGISVLAAYQVVDNKVKKTGGGLFPVDGKYAQEADSARAWYDNITASLFK